jgi:hypothetical protein
MWEVAIPFAWGPRTDLLSVYSMRANGWLELGFRESYLVEAATRAGWVIQKHECPLSFRANTWILSRPSSSPPIPPITAVTQASPRAGGGPEPPHDEAIAQRNEAIAQRDEAIARCRTIEESRIWRATAWYRALRSLGRTPSRRS